MNVYLAPNGGSQVPGDVIVRWVLRSDLTPIPRTVEMTLQAKSGIEGSFFVGSYFWTGREMYKYLVVKVTRDQGTGVVQGNEHLAAFTVTALLDSCAELSFRRRVSVVQYGASLGGIILACGATVGIGRTVSASRFVCMYGQVPSFCITQCLQESGSVIVLRNGVLETLRIQDLFNQEPVDEIVQTDSTDRIESEYLERHEIPSFYSLDEDGSFIFGDYDEVRSVGFMPHTNKPTLYRSTRVLVTRRIVDSHMAQQIVAGDIILVNGKKLAVITAAHLASAKDGITETSSRFWLGEMNK